MMIICPTKSRIRLNTVYAGDGFSVGIGVSICVIDSHPAPNPASFFLSYLSLSAHC